MYVDVHEERRWARARVGAGQQESGPDRPGFQHWLCCSLAGGPGAGLLDFFGSQCSRCSSFLAPILKSGNQSRRPVEKIPFRFSETQCNEKVPKELWAGYCPVAGADLGDIHFHLPRWVLSGLSLEFGLQGST